MKKLFYLIAFASFTLAGFSQNLLSYDLNPGTPGFTIVPQSAVWDASANEPLLKYSGSTIYVESLVSALEEYRNGSLSNADFFINNSIRLNGTTTGQPIQLFRSLLDFSDTKGLLITQANTTTAKNYLYRTSGKGLLTGGQTQQLTLDNLVLIDSVGFVRGQVKFKDKIVLSAGTTASGVELMVLDSNYNATVIDINTSAGVGSEAQQLFVWGDSLIFFQANDGTNGVELWRTDATLSGTVMVKNISASAGSSPTKFMAHGNKVFFSADDGTGTELWVTDGTNAGTSKVADINATTNAVPNNLTSGPNGLLYFAATHDNGNRLMYKTDGTQAGTVVVSPTVAVSPYSFKFELINNNLFFIGTAAGVSEPPALYVTNGTAGGTSRFFQPYSGSTTFFGISNSFSMTTNNGYLYFIANDSIHDYEVYRTDGTVPGTIQATNFAQSSSGSNFPNYLTPIPGGGIYFFGRDTIIGTELRILDLGLGQTVGENPIERTGDFSFYPNPVEDLLIIETPLEGSYNLALYDITGKLLDGNVVESSNKTIRYTRPTEAVGGIYFLRVSSNSAQQVLKVIYK